MHSTLTLSLKTCCLIVELFTKVISNLENIGRRPSLISENIWRKKYQDVANRLKRSANMLIMLETVIKAHYVCMEVLGVERPRLLPNY